MLDQITFSHSVGHAVRLAQQRFLQNHIIADATPKWLDKAFHVAQFSFTPNSAHCSGADAYLGSGWI